MEIPAHVTPFWAAFLAATGRPPATPCYEAFFFGDSESLATSLADLVLGGQKMGTATLVWENEVDGKSPRPGHLSVVTTWQGRPLCVIETTNIEVHAFEDVDAAFAAAEGEGDRSLEFWRKAHWNYFGRVCARLGREPSPRMPVVCEQFRVVFKRESLTDVAGAAPATPGRQT